MEWKKTIMKTKTYEIVIVVSVAIFLIIYLLKDKIAQSKYINEKYQECAERVKKHKVVITIINIVTKFVKSFYRFGKTDFNKLSAISIDGEYANVNGAGIILAFLTAFGAWGGFPTPPPFIEKFLQKHEIFQYFTVFILLYQGGGNKNWKLCGLVTFIFFAIDKLFKVFE